jgi:hypothetical protein
MIISAKMIEMPQNRKKCLKRSKIGGVFLVLETINLMKNNFKP